MTPLNVEESWLISMSSSNLLTNSYISATVHHTNSHITLGWPVVVSSPGQTDSQVSSQVHTSLKKHFNADISCIHWLIGCHDKEWRSLNLRWLGLGGETVKNLRQLSCKFDLDQSERKSSQVHASARKAWPNGVLSRPKFQLTSTCESFLARALNVSI